jgi:predicted kinase
MATAHLIFGCLGVGKTTFATDLAERVGAVLLSEDEWYLRLYTDGARDHLEREWEQRLTGVLDDLWPQILHRGIDVVLAFGFWRRGRRDAAKMRAVEVGGEAKLYWVTCDEVVARQRVAHRNNQPGASFQILGSAYDELRAKFEPLGPDEQFELIDTTPTLREPDRP